MCKEIKWYLDPIRARVAQTPEESDFTSVQERTRADQARKRIEASMAEAQQSQEPSTLPLYPADGH